MGPERPEDDFSRAGLGPVIRPPPTTAPAEQEAPRVSAGTVSARNIQVKFQPAVVIEVPSWKEETGKMNYSRPDASATNAYLAFGARTIPSEVCTERAGEADLQCSSVRPPAIG